MNNFVRISRDNDIAVITIDNPPVNALSPAVWTGIDDEPVTNAGKLLPALSQQTNGTWQMSSLGRFRNVTQHDQLGVLLCIPTLFDTAGQAYCSYTESEAIAANTTPVPAQVVFP